MTRASTLQRLRHSALGLSRTISFGRISSRTSTTSRRTVVDMPDQGETQMLAHQHRQKMIMKKRPPRRGSMEIIMGVFSRDESSLLEQGDTVECEASRPDWGERDVLVMSPEATGGKHGKFYSKRLHSVGFWSIEGNALQLTWGATGKLGANHAGESAMLIATVDARHFSNEAIDMRVWVRRPKRSPEWFRPDIVSVKLEAKLSAAVNFECPCCNFDLHVDPVAVVRSNSKRVCPHYMHARCGKALVHEATCSKRHAHCPTCYATFNEVKILPDLGSEPREWYSIVDADHSGSLSQDEIVEALGAVLPANKFKLQKWMHSRWSLWDPDGDGTISLDEFMVPRTGLRDCILSNLGYFRCDLRSQKLPPLPDEQPEKWFRYFDKNGNGLLDQQELLRGLVRTYCVTANNTPLLDQAREMRVIARSLWVGLNYTPYESIDYVEFSRPFGLMDQFIHNLTQLDTFGEDVEHVLSAAEMKHHFLT